MIMAVLQDHISKEKMQIGKLFQNKDDTAVENNGALLHSFLLSRKLHFKL